ncbi:hypothetical protein H5410_021310, partial [Solanum commersonii]
EVGDIVELGVIAEQKGKHLLEDNQGRHHLSLTPMLQGLIVKLLARLDSALLLVSVRYGITYSWFSLAPLRFVAPLVSTSSAMSVVKQKSFESFFRLAPPRSGEIISGLVIRENQCKPLFRIHMVLVDLVLVRPIRICIEDLHVREVVQTILLTLSRVQVPMVKDLPRNASSTIRSGSQPTCSSSVIMARGTSQSTKGGTNGGY